MTIPKTMKAAILFEQHKPLIVDEVQLPKTLKVEYWLKFTQRNRGSQLGEIDGAKGEGKFLPHPRP